MARDKQATVALVSGRNPKQCPDHGEPTNVKGDQPTYCLDCDRAVRATGDQCWRHVKPKPFVQIEAEQKAADEEKERQVSWAQRHHRKPKVQVRQPLTDEEKQAQKDSELAIRALRKAQKLRKARGLGAKNQ